MKLQSKLSKVFFDLRLGRTPDVLKMGRLLIAIKARTNTFLTGAITTRTSTLLLNRATQAVGASVKLLERSTVAPHSFLECSHFMTTLRLFCS